MSLVIIRRETNRITVKFIVCLVILRELIKFVISGVFVAYVVVNSCFLVHYCPEYSKAQAYSTTLNYKEKLQTSDR